jgi:hypothetical protein
MGKSRVVIKVSPKKSKGGTIIARQVVKVNKTKRPEGKPMFQTKAQVAIRVTTKNGEQRR